MKKTLGRQHPDLTQYIRSLANVHASSKVHKYKEALELYLMEYEILKKVQLKSHRSLLTVLNDIARVCILWGLCCRLPLIFLAVFATFLFLESVHSFDRFAL
jgi:hypothetical protein